MVIEEGNSDGKAAHSVGTSRSLCDLVCWLQENLTFCQTKRTQTILFQKPYKECGNQEAYMSIFIFETPISEPAWGAVWPCVGSSLEHG